MHGNEAKIKWKSVITARRRRNPQDVLRQNIFLNTAGEATRIGCAVQKASLMTHLIIVVVVGSHGVGEANQQRPPQRLAQQANMETHCTPYTSR